MPLNDPKILEKTFENYLRFAPDEGAARDMCRVLDLSELHNESKALEGYLDARNISPGRSGVSDWNERKCYSGPYPPSQPNLNDVWFDVVELMPMVLLPSEYDPSLDNACWLAMHPVYRWQFNGFLRCMKLGRKRTEVPSAPDYLSMERFEGLEPTKYVTDIYHDEALGYAHWFGKYLTGQFELMNAKNFLDEEEFSLVLPPGLLLWDESEFPASEFERLAFGSNTVFKSQEDQYKEFMQSESGENESLQYRTVYDEWERSEDIGFSTCVLLQVGLIKSIPRNSLFFVLRNAAPRL